MTEAKGSGILQGFGFRIEGLGLNEGLRFRGFWSRVKVGLGLGSSFMSLARGQGFGQSLELRVQGLVKNR